MIKVWHPWHTWECYRGGFFATVPPSGMDADEAMQKYAEFLADTARFACAMIRVTSEWPNSSEHWLTNEKMNRIAWLGQAAMCIDTGVPSRFRAGFKLLSEQQQNEANLAAYIHLMAWEHEYEKANRSVRYAVERQGVS